jgi:hypothetical protein
MQTEKQLRNAIKASLTKAQDAAEILLMDIDNPKQNISPAGEVMPRVRRQLAELNKALHEFNAYHNSLNT